MEPPPTLAALPTLLQDDHVVVWLDLIDPRPADLAVVQDPLGLHPLALEDALKAHQRPKIEEYGTSWFLVVHAVTRTPRGLALHEVAIFAGLRFVLTVRHSPAYAWGDVVERWLTPPQPVAGDGGTLLYTLLDLIVDGYFPVAEWLQERIDALDEAFRHGHPLPDDVLLQMVSVHKEVQRFRRAALPMQDILNPLLRRELPLFAPADLAYFRDVSDHAVRVVDQLDAALGLVTTALELHLAVMANRQNDVARQLTLIAVVFLPLTFLTGFFGQNFGYLTAHLSGSAPFWLLGVGGEVVALAALLAFFKVRRWF